MEDADENEEASLDQRNLVEELGATDSGNEDIVMDSSEKENSDEDEDIEDKVKTVI